VFDTLIDAAESYLARGGDPRGLTPQEVEKMKLLPDAWLTGYSRPLFPDANASDTRNTENGGPHFRAGVWLGVVRGNLVGIGLFGRYAALKPVMEKYSRFADKIYFPYPRDLVATSITPNPEQRTLLLMLFERSRLAAAARMRRSTSWPRFKDLVVWSTSVRSLRWRRGRRSGNFSNHRSTPRELHRDRSFHQRPGVFRAACV
jgi:hypothetical protein